MSKGGGLELWSIRDDDGVTAMHVAAYAGHSKVCVLLEKEFKMDPKCIDADGANITHYAAKGGRGSCYLALVEAHFKDTPLLPDAQGQTCQCKLPSGRAVRSWLALLPCQIG